MLLGLQSVVFIEFTEMQGHTVQRNTKAKKYATSIVGTLRLLTLSFKNILLDFFPLN